LAVTAVSAAYDAYDDKERKPRVTKNQAFAYVYADALGCWSTVDDEQPAEVEKMGKRLATQAAKVSKAAARLHKALAADNAAAAAPLLAQLSEVYELVKAKPAAAPAAAAPASALNPAPGPALPPSSTAAATTATPPPLALAQPATRHILDRRPPSQPPAPAAPLSLPEDDWGRGHAAGMRLRELEVERLNSDLRFEKSYRKKALREQQEESEGAVRMLQQALGECYYRLEKVGAQVVGDLTELRALAFDRDPAQLLWDAGYDKRRPLTPPEGRAVQRAEKRLKASWEVLDQHMEGFAEATAQLRALQEKGAENEDDSE